MRQGFTQATFWALAGALLLSCAPAGASSSVTVGDWLLLPDTPNQTITVNVTGTDQVAGLDFFAQIGDGGAINGGTNTKPKFQNVDIITGTIFGTNNTGAAGDPSASGPNSNHPLIWVDGTTTNTGTVLANGKLATLTVDTTGLTQGEFPLLLKGVASNLGPFDTQFTSDTGSTVPVVITNGRILVPEPGALGLLAIAGLLSLGRRRRS